MSGVVDQQFAKPTFCLTIPLYSTHKQLVRNYRKTLNNILLRIRNMKLEMNAVI